MRKYRPMRALLLLGAIGCGGTDQPPAGDGAGPPDERLIFDGATASWNLLHTEQSTGLKSMAINATSSGSLIVVGIETGPAQVAGVLDNSANTYEAIPAARAVDANQSVGFELWYAHNITEGATAITVDAPVVKSILVWEVAGIDPTAPLASAAKLDDQAATTTATGPELTATVDRQFVLSVVVVEHSVGDLINGGVFTNEPATTGTGRGHVSSRLAPAGTYQASWNQPTAGTFCASSAAFFASP